ncbi:UNVERIFIED_CONTAM: hypothetical protein NCL1_39632 [Trichonephila clavipes]
MPVDSPEQKKRFRQKIWGYAPKSLPLFLLMSCAYFNKHRISFAILGPDKPYMLSSQRNIRKVSLMVWYGIKFHGDQELLRIPHIYLYFVTMELITGKEKK